MSLYLGALRDAPSGISSVPPSGIASRETDAPSGISELSPLVRHATGGREFSHTGGVHGPAGVRHTTGGREGSPGSPDDGVGHGPAGVRSTTGGGGSSQAPLEGAGHSTGGGVGSPWSVDTGGEHPWGLDTGGGPPSDAASALVGIASRRNTVGVNPRGAGCSANTGGGGQSSSRREAGSHTGGGAPGSTCTGGGRTDIEGGQTHTEGGYKDTGGGQSAARLTEWVEARVRRKANLIRSRLSLTLETWNFYEAGTLLLLVVEG